MRYKWFHLVDLDGRTVGSATCAPVDVVIVAILRRAVVAECPNRLRSVDADDLMVYVSRVAFGERHAPLRASADIGSLGNVEDDALLVVAPSRQRVEACAPPTRAAAQLAEAGDADVLCHQPTRADPRANDQESTDDRKVVARGAGKLDLYNRSKQQQKRVVVASFSMLAMKKNRTFHDTFKKMCKIEWQHVEAMAEDGYSVYFIVDEAQMLYKTATSSPLRKSAEFWQLVKLVRNDKESGIRALLFAAYGSILQYAELSTPVEFPSEIVLGIEHLNFGPDEVLDYVTKWYDDFECLGDSMTKFCALLQVLTGGHVGLCATAIRTLNAVSASRARCNNLPPSAQDWNFMLQRGSLGHIKMFQNLVDTRAVKVLETLEHEHLDSLERLLYAANSDADDRTLERCVRLGILVRIEYHFEFSSPVMWRYFVKKRVGYIERASDSPRTLEELILRSLRAIDYNAIRTMLGRSLSSDIPLEKAWQMEFYKTVYHCMAGTCLTSADVGALFFFPGQRAFLISL